MKRGWFGHQIRPTLPSSRRIIAGCALLFATATLFVFAGPIITAYAQCDLPGGPTCEPPPEEEEPTRTPRPRPTRTFTPTPSATATSTSIPTSTSTPTATFTASATPTITPTAQPIPPLIDLIGKALLPLDPPAELIQMAPPWMSPPNIRVEAIEVTQAIQCFRNLECADNSVPLYTGKATLVRVYIRLTAGPNTHEPGIGGALCPGETGLGGCANPLRPINLTWADMIPDPVAKFRTNLDGTLDFILPPGWVASPTTLSLTAYANYKGENLPSEAYLKDNFRLLEAEVIGSKELDVMFALIQDHGVMADMSTEWPILAYLRGIFPTGDIRPWIGAQLLGKSYAFSTPQGNCGKGFNDLLLDLWAIRASYPQIYYGMLAAESVNKDPTAVSGCGLLGNDVAAGIVKPTKYQSSWADLVPYVGGHEIGHAITRAHAPGCGAGGPDPYYPRPNGHLDEVGIDVVGQQEYTTFGYDYMGYCGGAYSWTSVYGYQQIASALPAGVAGLARSGLASPSSSGPVLVASGQASSGGIDLRTGFFLMDPASAPTRTADEGPFAVDLLDAEGSILYSQHFLPLATDGIRLGQWPAQPESLKGITEGPFHLVLPAPEGVAEVVFRLEDAEVGRLAVSRSAPAVSWGEMQEGEVWDAEGLHALSWEASDPDGDTLQYLVQYSWDGGGSWQTVASGLDEPRLVLDAALLAGGSQASFRILVSDGLLTATATSPRVSVEGKPPLVHIFTSAYELHEGSPVYLEAVATDVEDGPIDPSSLVWTSLDGQGLGTGGAILIPSLPEGEHTILVMTVDQDGQPSEAEISLKVGPSLPTTLPQREGLPSAAACGILLAAPAALLAAAFALGRRSRRRGGQSPPAAPRKGGS